MLALTAEAARSRNSPMDSACDQSLVFSSRLTLPRTSQRDIPCFTQEVAQRVGIVGEPDFRSGRAILPLAQHEPASARQVQRAGAGRGAEHFAPRLIEAA